MKTILNYILEKYQFANNGDEFYTQEKDIEKEVKNYPIKGKIIYCNCDNPSFSKFYKYFKDNFEKLGIKKLIATYYDKDPQKYEYDGKNEIHTKIKSGDFRDNIDILKECDIVITNPPFADGLPEELLKLCIENNKDFLFLGPNHFATKKYTLEQLKNGKLHIGYNRVHDFVRPNGEIKGVSCFWYTSFDTKKSPIKLTKEYNPKIYKKYDNIDAINSPHILDIPKDYDGIVGTSIDFPFYYDKNQFEIIGSSSPKLDGQAKFKKCFVKLKK